jgi:hypothetical protein
VVHEESHRESLAMLVVGGVRSLNCRCDGLSRREFFPPRPTTPAPPLATLPRRDANT